jgi:hypothetical protein
LAPEAFHGPLGELALLVAPHTEGDPAALLLQAVVAFGSLVGRVAFYQHEATEHGTNLFLAVVGQSSRGRKGTALDWVRKALAMTDPTWASERMLSGLSSGEGVLWAVRDPIYKTEAVKARGKATGEVQTVLVDPGVDDKRLLVVEGELAQALKVLQREGNTLSPVLRRAWDDGNLRTLTKNSPAVATGAHVSIIGHVTAFELRTLLASADVHNGFANRVLWACARRSKLLPDGGDLPEGALVPIADALREAAEASRRTGRVERSPAAREVWHAVYPTLTADVPGILGAVTSRGEAQALRLSLVYALADRSRVIEPAHLLAALAVWQYCAASAAHIFGDATGDRTADRILDALSAHPEGQTRDEIRELFDRHKSARELDTALDLLASAALAVCDRRTDTGGRPATVWRATGSARAESAISAESLSDED